METTHTTDRDRRGERGVGVALVLIALGGIFLLQNLGRLPAWGNWWALFILIPAAGSAGTAWTLYRRAGDRVTPAARRSALGAVALTFVAAMFLFGLNWGLLWPVFLILFGLEALVSRGGTGDAPGTP
jgi:hypothetical protein